MHCNKILNNILIILISIVMINIQILDTSRQHIKITYNQEEGTTGDLYDVFKKRLQVIQNELTYHKVNDMEQISKFTKKRDPLNNIGKEKSVYENLLNKDLEKQLKYVNIADRALDNSEEYRKKMNNIYNELSLDGASKNKKDNKSNVIKFKYLNNESVKCNHLASLPRQQLSNMSEIINEEKGHFTKHLNILPINSYLTIPNAIRDILNGELQKQIEIINNAMPSLEERNYCQAAFLNKDNNYVDEESYDTIDTDVNNRKIDYELWHLLPQKVSNSNLHRRQVTSNSVNQRNLDNTSLYPSVLTKALEISLNPIVHSNSGGSLLANVAQRMNTSTLDLAEKLAKSTNNLQTDGHAQLVQNFMTNNSVYSGDNMPQITNKVDVLNNNIPSQPLPSEISTRNGLKPIASQGEALLSPVQAGSAEIVQEYEESHNGLTTSSLTSILDRVLSKLESIHDDKNKDDVEHPNGAPCDIIGSWSSTTLGLCFDIQLNKEKVRDVSPAEINNKILSIGVQECTPPKPHQIIDLEWKFGGSAFKQLGGPFYIYAQKRSESLVGAFLGYCRTCSGIDTIFGSWTFLSPSKDCQDISLAFDVKRDLLRRDRMEIKRKERFKDLLYQTRIGKSKSVGN